MLWCVVLVWQASWYDSVVRCSMLQRERTHIYACPFVNSTLDWLSVKCRIDFTALYTLELWKLYEQHDRRNCRHCSGLQTLLRALNTHSRKGVSRWQLLGFYGQNSYNSSYPPKWGVGHPPGVCLVLITHFRCPATRKKSSYCDSISRMPKYILYCYQREMVWLWQCSLSLKRPL